MRFPSLIVVSLAILAGCHRTAPPPKPIAPPAYSPVTFRADVTRLISIGDYAAAVALVRAVDVDRQLTQDGGGYIAIGEDMIILLGIENIDYVPSRDWYVPGTQDAIQDMGWQQSATDFARQYNQRRIEWLNQ
jgi:hypothetical protein